MSFSNLSPACRDDESLLVSLVDCRAECSRCRAGTGWPGHAL